MDLYVTRIFLSVKQISGLSKGESNIYSRVNRIFRLRSQILYSVQSDVKNLNVLFTVFV